MAEKIKKSKSSVNLPSPKKLKMAVIKQEPVDPENGHEIMLPELHIKDEHPDWQMEECSTEERFPEQNSASSVGRTTLGKSIVSNHCITDSEGSIKYADLKKDLKQFIETTVEEVVERCFQKHFAQLAALIGSINKPTVGDTELNYDINTNNIETENEEDAENQELEQEHQNVPRVISTSPPPLVPLQEPFESPLNEHLQEDVKENVVEDELAANHVKITNENEVQVWDEKLKDDEYFNKYIRYFENIIVPNSYVEMGDNAGFVIAERLFVPEFWDRLSWAGYKKPGNTKASFSVFQNVIRLLLQLISIGDPMYSRQKLEMFIRRRMLFKKRGKVRN